MMSETITVIDVIKSMGVEPSRSLTLRVGSNVRDAYYFENGGLPAKELRRKTNGAKGSHCIAVYPSYWRPRIESAVKHAVAA